MARRVKITETGGRDATTRHIPPTLALAVGMPSVRPPAGWRWTKLTDLARLESGHTPSRRRPDWWGGSIPWVSIKDARDNHGRQIDDTLEHTNKLGIQNSAARVLPGKTVCLSRTASVGYVVVMGRPMATSQDFVNWVCSDQLDPDYLKYVFIAEGDGLLRFASGAVHQTIYFPEVKAFFICHPPPDEQRRIARNLDNMLGGIATVKANAERNLQNARALFESHLQSAFNKRGKGSVETTLGAATAGLFTGPFGSLLHKSDYVQDGIPLVNPAHITETGIEPDLRKTVSTKTADRLKSYVMRKGDIVIGRRGEMGRCALVTEKEDGWLCGTGSFFIKPSDRCDPRYLVRFLRSQGCRERLERLAGGAVMPNLSNTALAGLTMTLPSVKQQEAVVNEIDSLTADTQRLSSAYERKLVALDELSRSLLHAAFTGQLAAGSELRVRVPVLVQGMSKTDMHAGILAMAYQLHEAQGKVAQFTHVKAEKIAHMVEARVGLDLDRTPVKDAAGPNDFPRLRKVEHRARRANFFDFKQGQDGSAYKVQKLGGFNRLVERTRETLGDNLGQVEGVLTWMLRMTVQQAEIVATVYAAWNNLLIDRRSPSDDEIAHESRENWHPNKLKIDRERFLSAIKWLRKEGVVPNGTGKRVFAKGAS